MSRIKIYRPYIAEMEALVSHGDLSLLELRDKFAAQAGRRTALDDEKMLIVAAGHTDDDDELLFKVVVAVENGPNNDDGYELVDVLPEEEDDTVDEGDGE